MLELFLFFLFDFVMMFNVCDLGSKSLVKKVKVRTDVMKRKRLVVAAYLKQDIAHLLRDGHDSHALARVDGLTCEIDRAWCYDYIEKNCVSLLQQLSSMQRQRDCPAECVEAVSCVMFAAARFADLPELCDVRSMFIEKYGSSLEAQVNQKFVEKIASKPTTTDQKLELLLNISQEFSLGWNGKHTNSKRPDPLVAQHVYKPPLIQASVNCMTDLKNEKREAASNQRIKVPCMLDHPGRKENSMEKCEHGNRKNDSSCNRTPDYPNREEDITKFAPSLSEESGENLRPRYGNMLPPPYVKPNKRQSALPPPYVKPSKHEINSKAKDIGSSHEKESPALSSGCNSNIRRQNAFDFNNGTASRGKGERHDHENALTHSQLDERSVRKMHAGPSTIENHVSSQDKLMKTLGHRSNRGRRRGKNTKYKDDFEDEEEAIMDKLLIHYSKKSVPSEDLQRIQSGRLKAPTGNEDGGEGKLRMGGARAPVRTLSLPNKPAVDVEKKVPVRSASFKPESSNRNHVHPKLPDYDELAAQFAALKRGP